MATGFTQRWKGKTSASAVWWQGTQVFGPGTVFTGNDATATKTIPVVNGIALLTAATAAAVWMIGATPIPGQPLLVSIPSVSSAIFVKAPSGVSFDASTNTVFKSTYAMQVTLRGISSLAYRIEGVWPPPSTLVGGSGITLTTTT